MSECCPLCGSPKPKNTLGFILQDSIILKGDRRIDLRCRREIALMHSLARHWPKLVSKDTLLWDIYEGDEPENSDNCLECHVSRLRSKLKTIGLTIENRRYVGYRLQVWRTAKQDEKTARAVADEMPLVEANQ